MPTAIDIFIPCLTAAISTCSFKQTDKKNDMEIDALKLYVLV